MTLAPEEAFVHSNPPPGIEWDEWEQWDQKSKERALEELALADKPLKVWYCKRGRRCDGEPHDGYPYRHARGRDAWCACAPRCRLHRGLPPGALCPQPP